MLYGNLSISYYSRSNVLIWLVMAFQAGVLNVGGFMAGHQIVSHVTGFATFFGYHLSQGHRVSVAEMLLLPLIFLFGGMVSGFFVDIRLKLNKKPKYYITFGMMFFLTLLVFIAGLLGFWGEFGRVSERSYLLLVILCFVCGVQNGTISIVSKSMIRTTHLTGLTTDLGLGLVRILYNQGSFKERFEGEGRANLMRFGIISSFIFGSGIGGLAFHRWEFQGFLLPTLISGGLFILMIYFQIFHPRPQDNKA